MKEARNRAVLLSSSSLSSLEEAFKAGWFYVFTRY
jgi:hypothetical protein